MKIQSKINILSSIIFFSFWLLFPGFFIYQVAINLGLIPSFLGGYFGIVSLILFIPLMSVFLLKLHNEQKVLKQLDIVFLTLLTYILLIAIYHYIFGEFSGNKDLLLWNISGVLFNLECLTIGKVIPNISVS